MNQPEIDPPMGESDGRVICQDATIGWPGEAVDDETSKIAAFTLKGLDFEPPQNQMTIVCGPLGSGKTLLVSHPTTCSVAVDPSYAVYWEKLECWKAPSSRLEHLQMLSRLMAARFSESGRMNLG
jgi:hypothetical protein